MNAPTRPQLDLPEQPDGFTRRLVMHLNFGDAGGGAVYAVFDQEGNRMPFSYQYDTRKGGLTGFCVPTTDGVMTWQQVREHYAKGHLAQADGPMANDQEGGAA